MALDNGYHIAAHAPPTPTDTPYETPSRDLSGHSSRQGSSSPFSNYSPAPFPPDEDSFFVEQQGAADTGEDDRYNARDPRRLTPNLGISFVSQIHTLKKDLEGRDDVISGLEETLHQTKAENEQLSEDLKVQRAEVKSVKFQMSSLEQDMLQALEDIAKERDNATEIVGDTRKKLEVSKKKMRTMEEEANKSYLQWDREKQEWEGNKRKLETKVHVVEERLKTMVAEMMAVHSTGQNRPGSDYDMDEGVPETWAAKGNDSRAASRLSNRSIDDPYGTTAAKNYRESRMSGLHEMGGSQMSGLSLADELEMTEDDEHDVHSPDALPEELDMIPRRYPEDKKARKVMGFLADQSEKPFGDENSGQHSMGIIEDYMNLPGKRSSVVYTDIGIQTRALPASAIQTKSTDYVPEKLGEQTERSANQSRKRVAIPAVFIEQSPSPKIETLKDVIMVSTSSQTDGSSQNTQSVGGTANDTPLLTPAVTREMRSTSTQTIEAITMGSKSASTRLSPLPLDVPVIAIHPPTSRPPSSHNSVVLPPRTRNAGCQVMIEIPRNLTSTAMQTDEIRPDKRPVKIPPRLHTSNVAARPSSRSTEKRIRTTKSSFSEPSRRDARSTPRLAADNVKASISSAPRGNLRIPPPPAAIEQQSRPTLPQSGHIFPEDHADGLLNNRHSSDPRRPAKPENVFADFDATCEDYKADAVNDLSDDDEFTNAVPIRKTLSKVQNSWKLVPQPQNTALDRLDSASEEAGDRKAEGVPPAVDSKARRPSQNTSDIPPIKSARGFSKAPNAAKQADIRRKTLVSNGIAEHAQRVRSPSVPNTYGKEPPVVAPPFPVPTRSSSRKIPISSSDGAASPTPYSTSFFTARRGQDHGRPPIKRKILRKVQSAAAVPKAPERRPPPPPPSISAASTVPASPKSLGPPRNQFILPYDSVAELPSNAAPISQSRSHAGEASIETPSQQTSVVDAIAQTMVGEWMWKYVRKRTSFGITENPQAEFEMGRHGETGNSSGVRHKRWVWLAPYENAVIWSSKQPTSGPALLGKGGRKRMFYFCFHLSYTNIGVQS